MQHREDAKLLATNHWQEILVSAGIDENSLEGLHCPCPICGGRDRFRFDDLDGRGTYFCNGCGPGDGFKLLMGITGWGFKEAADHVRHIRGQGPQVAAQRIAPPVASSTSTSSLSKQKKKHEALVHAWDKARPILVGDAAWLYLTETRKLPIKGKLPSCLRFHPRMAYYDDVIDAGGNKRNRLIGYFGCMLAKVVNPDNHAVSIHRTYLTMDGRKAPVTTPKKLMPGLGIQGGAIRLMPHSGILGVAEGIETAFAAHFLTGVPTWATISAKVMKGFVPPEGVRKLVIFSDNDLPDAQGRRAGQDAAAELKERCASMGISSTTQMPMTPGWDIYDVWMERLNKAKA